MSDFNDFGFSTVSEDEYRAQQTTQVDTAKEVASTATASLQPELDKIESKISRQFFRKFLVTPFSFTPFSYPLISE